MERVLRLIGEGQADGARLVCGGTRSEGDLATGNFVTPTLFTDVSNDMTIAREEIFGPVLSLIPFGDEDEAVRIANATEHGLAATVWANDIKRTMRTTKAIRAGTVGINGYQLEPHAAFGGHRQSGIGREGGRPAIEAYTELKPGVPFAAAAMDRGRESWVRRAGRRQAGDPRPSDASSRSHRSNHARVRRSRSSW
jgi:aldehyde dehydrogenase (NAD+)